MKGKSWCEWEGRQEGAMARVNSVITSGSGGRIVTRGWVDVHFHSDGGSD